MSEITENIAPEKINEMIAFLSKVEIFEDVPYPALRELCKKMSLVTISSGEKLINEGDVGDCLYVVIYGRLKVTRKKDGSDDGVKVLGEIYPGEIVGEISLLINQPRTATVMSMRDSVVLKLSKNDLNDFIEHYPHSFISISRKCVKRLTQRIPLKTPGTDTRNIVIAPAGIENSEFSEIAREVYEELEKSALTLYLNSQTCDKMFGRSISQAALEGSDNELLISWLNHQGNNYHYIIFEADKTLTPWTLRCLRNADRLIFVCNSERNKQLNEIEEECIRSNVFDIVYTELVLLHKNSVIAGTGEWLQNRPYLQSYHHIRKGNANDTARYMRFMSGKALGLALGGGGAKGFAYVGVCQALEELGIKIDFFCGTSIGALAASLYARECNSEQIYEIMKWFAENLKKNYTLPILSISSSKYLTKFIKEKICGPIEFIEDLPISFFCNSTNLFDASIVIHERGSLFHALRASTSIPGVYPPVSGAHQELLVDGGVLNNLPIDLLKQRICGGKILALTCGIGQSLNSKFPVDNLSITGWEYWRYRRMNQSKDESIKLPTMAEVIMQAMTIGSQKHEMDIQALADFHLDLSLETVGVLDFYRYQYCYDLGYKMGKKYFPTIIEDLPYYQKNY